MSGPAYRAIDMVPDEKYLAEVRLLNSQAAANEQRANILAEIKRSVAINNELDRNHLLNATAYSMKMDAIGRLYIQVTK